MLQILSQSAAPEAEPGTAPAGENGALVSWRELVNSDAQCYAGSGQGNAGGVEAEPAPWHGRPFSLKLVLPPLAALFFAPGRGAPAAPGTPA